MGCHSGASSAAKVASGGATTTATNTSKTINSVTVDGINTSYDRTTASLFHPAGTKAVHITSHEAGHVLERALIEKTIPGSDFWSQIGRSQAWDKSQCASKVISEAARQAKKTPAGKGKKIDTLIAEVSGYARKNRSETLAECVADYAANGSKARALSQEVWKVLKRELG